MGKIISLAIALLIAYFTSRMAAARGRDPLLWGILGFFFPIITIIVLLVIGRKK